jgi:hypothetical protein
MMREKQSASWAKRRLQKSQQKVEEKTE